MNIPGYDAWKLAGPDDHRTSCATCDGEGEYECPACEGTGGADDCRECDGSGSVTCPECENRRDAAEEQADHRLRMMKEDGL